jgi:hypothetical protein
MKKPYFVFIFFIFCGFSIFGNNDNREEVDSLLFMPNSGNRFANEEQAFIQLNNLARFFSDKNLKPGQIIVHGYAASAPNNIKSDDLSRERALTVIEELQKRGVSKDLFADPVGHGAVYLWGGNTDENDRKLNRRVRILLDGETPIPVTQEVITAEIETPKAKAPAIEALGAEAGKTFKKETIAPKYSLKYQPKKANYKFFWWLLPLLAILLLLFLLLLLFKDSSRRPAHKAETAKAEPPVSQMGIVPAIAPIPAPEPEPAPDFIPAEAVTTWTVNLDDEIRFRAYELSQQRRVAGQRDEQGDYREQDWYNAVREISAWYKASGHSVFIDGGCWWASRSYSW